MNFNVLFIISTFNHIKNKHFELNQYINIFAVYSLNFYLAFPIVLRRVSIYGGRIFKYIWNSEAESFH